ncbi:acyltransferase family protein [Bradyrhizobium pachyrhizi]|uniref:acyltransferase family protein n=1 Tax=Bradyrhizobium pachyrhizi TaxID=280333 RepID=UPI003D36B756
MGRNTERLGYLDAIRGLAALIVVTSHLAFADDALNFIDTTGIKLLRASGFAVVLFFVLSGFVLFRQIEHDRPTYPAFVVRRIFRLFPPCIAAVSASYAIYLVWSPTPVAHLTQWFNGTTWPAGITLAQYLAHLPLTGEDALLRPIWSLVYEWRVSLIFPIVAAAFVAAPRLVPAVTLAAAVALAKTSAWQSAEFAWCLYTAFYGSFFLAGMVIARYQAEIADFLGRQRYLRYAIFALVFYWTDLRSQQSGLIGVFYAGIAAALFIIAAVADPPLQKALEIRPLAFLGRISYSLYLWHVIVIGVLFRALDGWPPLVVGASCMVCSVALAAAMYRLTELPFIRIGRRLTKVGEQRPSYA